MGAKKLVGRYLPGERGWVKTKDGLLGGATLNERRWHGSTSVDASAHFANPRRSGSTDSFDRASHDRKASLEALAQFTGVGGGKIHNEVGQLDALCGNADNSGSRTDPSDVLLVSLLWPPSERLDGLPDRGPDARVYEIVHRPVRIFENVMEDRSTQLRELCIWPKCLRNVKCVRQVELARIISTVLERSRGD